MVNAALSRRLGRVMNMEPLTRLGAVDRLELGRRVDAAGSFEELSPEDRELILAAEEMRERLIAEKRELGEQMAAGRPRRTSARGA